MGAAADTGEETWTIDNVKAHLYRCVQSHAHEFQQSYPETGGTTTEGTPPPLLFTVQHPLLKQHELPLVGRVAHS